MICSECGSGPMRLTDEPIAVNYRGESVTIEGIRHWQCDKCGSYEVDLDEADRLNRAVRKAWADEHGYDPLSPREIRKIRKSLKMTQQEFEKALGVSSPTVSRWETGKVTQSRTADILMRRLAVSAHRTFGPTFVLIEGEGKKGTSYRQAPGNDNDFVLEG